jgi:hypothetical protein
MTKEKNKTRRIRDVPIEEHSTAAWANIAKEKPGSKVAIPRTDDMEIARDWVNQNRK